MCIDFALPPRRVEFYRSISQDDRIPAEVHTCQVGPPPEAFYLQLEYGFFPPPLHFINAHGVWALNHYARNEGIGQFIHIVRPRSLPVICPVIPLRLDERGEVLFIRMHVVSRLQHSRGFGRSLCKMAALEERRPGSILRNSLVVKQVAGKCPVVVPVPMNRSRSELVLGEESIHLTLVLLYLEVIPAVFLIHVRHCLGTEGDHLVPPRVYLVNLCPQPVRVQLEIPRRLLEQRPLRLIVELGLLPRGQRAGGDVRPKV
mmetsp:Transcript_3378/g.4178  ORF Transcript_3378/g.4178 Transcript_3378/m.4178 type:complete len:259 (+) Transcript_3378:516-1292(+)